MSNRKYKNRKNKNKFTLQQRKTRLTFALKYSSWPNKEWKNIIFTSKKVFTDINNGEKLIIWAAVNFYHKIPVSFILKNMNASEYVELLEFSLINFIDKGLNQDVIVFQQNNSPCHLSKITKVFLQRCNIKVMKWPENSFDLSPFWNIWSELSMNVFKENRKFSSIIDFNRIIQEEWSKLKIEKIQRYIRIAKKRLTKLILTHGNGI